MIKKGNTVKHRKMIDVVFLIQHVEENSGEDYVCKGLWFLKDGRILNDRCDTILISKKDIHNWFEVAIA